MIFKSEYYLHQVCFFVLEFLIFAMKRRVLPLLILNINVLIYHHPPQLTAELKSHSSLKSKKEDISKRSHLLQEQAGADLWCGGVLAFIRWLFIVFPRGKVKHHLSV